MSISKRMYGVEGFQVSSTELTLADIKKLIPIKVKDYKLIGKPLLFIIRISPKCKF